MSDPHNSSFEFKRADLTTWLSVVWPTIGIRVRQWVFFVPSLVLNILAMLAHIATFFLMAQFVAPGAAPFLQEYNGRFGAYVLLGVVLNGFLSTSLTAYYNAYAEGYWSNTFELFIVHPMGISAFMTGSVLYNYLVSSFNTLLYLVIGVLVFGVPLGGANYGAFFAILGLATIGMTGLGWAAASTFTLLNSRAGGDPVTWAVTFLAGILSGVYFPPSVLPKWMSQIGECLPQTYALHAGRLVLLRGVGLTWPSVQADLTHLLALIALYLPLGYLLFLASFRKAERQGSLTRWN